jgi:Spy/CpxP family protein refolding chaperone
MLKKVILLVALVALVASTQVFAADDSSSAAKPAPAPARERNVPAAPGGGGAGGMGRGMGGFGMMGMGVWGIAQQLPNLTDDQKTKINDLQTSMREKMMASGQASMTAMMKVTELVNAGAGEAEVKAAAAEYAKLWTEQQVQSAASVKQLRSLLTADQITELDKQLKERAAQMGQRGQGRGQGGQGGQGGQRGQGGAGAPAKPAAPAGGAQN